MPLKLIETEQLKHDLTELHTILFFTMSGGTTEMTRFFRIMRELSRRDFRIIVEKGSITYA